MLMPDTLSIFADSLPAFTALSPVTRLGLGMACFASLMGGAHSLGRLLMLLTGSGTFRRMPMGARVSPAFVIYLPSTALFLAAFVASIAAVTK
jgi:hypothetical protein